VHLPRVLPFGSRDEAPRDCRCGHGSRAHEHYRRGSDCALCTCPKFKAGNAAARDERGARGAGGERARAA
jgi:hypothetical protein